MYDPDIDAIRRRRRELDALTVSDKINAILGDLYRLKGELEENELTPTTTRQLVRITNAIIMLKG